jgi:hypothetical protein
MSGMAAPRCLLQNRSVGADISANLAVAWSSVARLSAVYVVAGFGGLVAVVATFVLAMRGAERAVARALGLPRFRWFDVEPAPAWKVLVVRAASTLVPFGICVAIFFVVTVVRGLPESGNSTVVNVLADGAAHEAGMHNGDRVVAIAGAPVSTWDELRAQVARHSEPVQVTFERAGHRQSLSVVPRNNRIGVTPTQRMRDASLAEAAKLALVLPLRIVRDSAKALTTKNEAKDLRGPVGIVNETSNAARAGWDSVLYFLGILGSYFWPFIAATHAFDVVTGWLFRLTFTPTQLPMQAVQIARLRLTMYFSLGCWLVMVGAQAASLADIPGTIALAMLVTPGVWAVWPLLWVSARSLGKGNWPLGVVLPVVLVPCAAPVMAIVVAQQLGKEERRLRSHTQTAEV